tara:strand:- start:416 stop:643 length:228 start_codon:yes stop_codon:yes gene_type:complete
MSKYYISTGTLELIYSTDKEAYDACRTVIHEMNKYDELDEFMYCDERGMKNYLTATPKTMVFITKDILEKEGYGT